MANIERFSIIVTERGSRRVANGIRGIGIAASSSLSNIRLLTGALGVLGAAFSVAKLFQLADGFTTIQNQIRLVTDSSEELVKVQSQVYRVAQETRLPLAETAVLYRRLALATQDLNVEQGDLIDITRTINQLIQISGATAIEAKQGIIQLSQGIASGALRGDELRSTLEQIPAVGRVIAKSLRVTFGQLRALGEQGRITGAAILNAMLEAGEMTEQNFLKIVPTIGQAFQVLENDIQQTLGILIGGGSGDEPLLGELSKKIIEVSENIDQIVGSALATLVEKIGLTLKEVAKLVQGLEAVGITVGSLKSTFRLLGLSAVASLGGIRVVLLGIRQDLLAGAVNRAKFKEFFGIGDTTKEDIRVLQDLATVADIDLAEALVKTEDAAADLAYELGVLAREANNGIKGQFELSKRIDALADGAPAAAAGIRAYVKAIQDQKRAEDTLARGDGTPITDPGATVPKETKTKTKIKYVFKTEELRPLNSALESGVEAAITDGVGQGFRALLDGEVLDFAEVFSSILKDALTQSLTDTLRDALLGVKGSETTGSTSQGLIRDLASGIGGLFGTGQPQPGDPDFVGPLPEGQSVNSAAGGGGGGGVNYAAGLASLAVAGGIIAAGFASTSKSASSSITSSAVENVQATRGVVVGPQDIAIFKVGDAIADAFIPIQSLAVARNATLVEILAAVRGGGIAGNEDAGTLDAMLAGELNTSPSLG